MDGSAPLPMTKNNLHDVGVWLQRGNFVILYDDSGKCLSMHDCIPYQMPSEELSLHLKRITLIFINLSSDKSLLEKDFWPNIISLGGYKKNCQCQLHFILRGDPNQFVNKRILRPTKGL